jgi:LuxR family transcriptional regulator, maltose regulon positive regulatory protein
MREVDNLLKRRPGLETLVGGGPGAPDPALQKNAVQVSPGVSALTAAELRLLPLLSTHLSVPEVAAEMFLSRYTIKSEAMSIYRKRGILTQRGSGPVP